MEYPKILVISNGCLSKASSNGRTLLNFLSGWPQEKLYQFYKSSEIIDSGIVQDYYQVTDGDALCAFLHKKKSKSATTPPVTVSGADNAKEKRIQKNPVTAIIREVIWNSNCWGKKNYFQWIEQIKPDVILFQAGDFGYLCKLAYKTALKFQLPVIIYNSENYYFKNYDYTRSSGIKSAFYPISHSIFKKNFARLIRYASMSVYICDSLKEKYDVHFGKPSITLYTASALKPMRKTRNELTRFSYLGNLGLDRDKCLIDMAEILYSLNPQLRIDVYGNADSDITNRLNNAVGINFHGCVSYSEVQKVMEESDVLIHVESFDSYYQKDLEDAFSTKIADNLSSGKCFLVYAPSNLACTKYLRKNKAAYVADNINELKEVLKQILTSTEERNKYSDRAIELAKKNHNAENNSRVFQQLIVDILDKKK